MTTHRLTLIARFNPPPPDHEFIARKPRDFFAALRRRELNREVRDIVVGAEWELQLNGKKLCQLGVDFYFYDITARYGRLVNLAPPNGEAARIKLKLLEAQFNRAVEVV